MNYKIAFIPGTGRDDKIVKLLKDWFPQSKILYVPILSPTDKHKPLEEMTISAEKFLRDRNWFGSIIIGYSIGGQIALSLAKSNILNIARLILVSTPFDGNFFKPTHEKILNLIFSKKGQPVFNWLMQRPKLIYNPVTVRLIYPKLILKKDSGEVYNMELNAETMPQWFYSLHQMQQQDFSKFLKINKLPINVIYGDNDDSFLPGYYEQWQQFPNIKIHKLPGDHNPIIENLDAAKVLLKKILV